AGEDGGGGGGCSAFAYGGAECASGPAAVNQAISFSNWADWWPSPVLIMRTYSLLLIGAVAMVPLTSGGAHAAPPAGKSDVATDKARQLHVEGDDLYTQGDYARARVSYVAAWALKKNWQLAGSLGDCELKLGFYRDAAEHLAYFLRMSPTQPPSDDATKLYNEAQAKTARLNLAVDLPGADVVVDGKFVGKSPLVDPVFVEPGAHAVEIRLGEKLKTFHVDLAKGAPHPLSVALAGSQGRTSEDNGPKLPILLGGAALSLGALGAGIGLMAASGGKGADADAVLQQMQAAKVVCTQPPVAGPCQDIVSLRQSHDTLHNAALPLLVGGGVLAVATLSYALWPRGGASPKTTGLRVIPVVGAEAGGLWVGGAF
ncbi:MAG: tetratricopeptide repeat protein, partial [Byssovorax sp.]